MKNNHNYSYASNYAAIEIHEAIEIKENGSPLFLIHRIEQWQI